MIFSKTLQLLGACSTQWGHAERHERVRFRSQMRHRGARQDNGNQIILSIGGGFLCSTLDRHFGQAERPTEHGLLKSASAEAISVAWSPAPKDPRPAFGSSRKRPIFPTKFAKIVVTDDQGRYVIPGLPKASYSVWVRGYGLVDSPKRQARPGVIVNLTAVEAPTPAAAADYYPALYWYALLKIPGKSEFSGSGRNGIPPALKSQEQWLDIVKTDGCFTCHQIGDKATRTIPKELGHFRVLGGGMGTAYSVRPGERRHGQCHRPARHESRLGAVCRLDGPDCRRRIACDAAAAAARRRAQCRLTIWDWATPKAYLHDEISTDKRNPTVNANGPIYGVARGEHGFLPDPRSCAKRNEPSEVARARSGYAIAQRTTPFRCPRPIGETSRSGTVRPMCTILCSMNGTGVVYVAHCVRRTIRLSAKQDRTIPRRNCSRSKVPAARLAMYDPKTNKFTLIDTCFGTHHLHIRAGRKRYVVD